MSWIEFLLTGPDFWGQVTWLGLALAFFGIAWCAYLIGRLEKRIDKALKNLPIKDNIHLPSYEQTHNENRYQNCQLKDGSPITDDSANNADSPLEKSPDRMSN